jgi:hypothetical protein
MNNCSRRNFLYMTGAGALAGAASRTSLYGQQEIPAPVPAPSIFPYESRSPVSLVKGDDRRKNITEALLAMDKEIGPAIKRKKYVVIKINNVATIISWPPLTSMRCAASSTIWRWHSAIRDRLPAVCRTTRGRAVGPVEDRHSWGEARYREARIQIT